MNTNSDANVSAIAGADQGASSPPTSAECVRRAFLVERSTGLFAVASRYALRDHECLDDCCVYRFRDGSTLIVFARTLDSRVREHLEYESYSDFDRSRDSDSY